MTAETALRIACVEAWCWFLHGPDTPIMRAAVCQVLDNALEVGLPELAPDDEVAPTACIQCGLRPIADHQFMMCGACSVT